MSATHDSVRQAIAKSILDGRIGLEREEVKFLLLVLDRDEMLALLASKIVEEYLGEDVCLYCRSTEVEEDGWPSHLPECPIGLMQDVLLGFDVKEDIMNYERNNRDAKEAESAAT